MPQENIPPLPDHRDCEILTVLTIDSIPRDGSLGRARSYRKSGNVWKPDDRSDGIFFLASGQIAIIANDRWNPPTPAPGFKFCKPKSTRIFFSTL